MTDGTRITVTLAPDPETGGVTVERFVAGLRAASAALAAMDPAGEHYLAEHGTGRTMDGGIEFTAGRRAVADQEER